VLQVILVRKNHYLVLVIPSNILLTIENFDKLKGNISKQISLSFKS